jgi:hypothetical protein
MPRKVRPIRIEGQVAYVPLTQGYEAVIDAEDAPLVSGWNWYARVQPGGNYAIRTDGSSGKRICVHLHRFIMDAPDGLEVDHIDGDGLNNRRCNLRLATRSQNMRNQRLNSRNTSGFKGVSWDKRDKKWLAYIKVYRKKIHLGSFDTPEDAHAAYCDAAARLHGEFAKLG